MDITYNDGAGGKWLQAGRFVFVPEKCLMRIIEFAPIFLKPLCEIQRLDS